MDTKQTRSAGGVVLNRAGQVLVVNQKGTSWSLPKGHIDGAETPLEAAKREIEEESGITELELVKELGAYQRHRIGKDGGDDLSELKTISMFLFKTGQRELRPKDIENPEARWMERGQVAGILTHKKDKEFFTRIIKEI
jgi:ADP-ribose pyrophosphatase YjhB (NUDIX family)